MFDKITNDDLKGAFERLKGYVAIRIWVIAIVAAIVVSYVLLSLSTVATDLYKEKAVVATLSAKAAFEELDNLQPQVESTPVPTPAMSVAKATEVVLETTKLENVTAPVALSYNPYDMLWDYLEYGDTVEYFNPQPEDMEATFYFTHGGVDYVKSLELKPPQFRALAEKFSGRVVYKEDDYWVSATVRGSKVVDVVGVYNYAGQLVWNPNMEKGPRELNPLEKWSVAYANAKGYDFLIKDWFDAVPDCSNEAEDWGGGSPCRYVKWSPAEEHARAQAFFNFATDPTNNVWVEVWGAVDERYRWADAETGKLLEVADEGADLWNLPESGWLALQIGSGGTYENPETWETTYTIKVSPGFVVGIDQAGFVFESGPLGWVMSEKYEAPLTQAWSIEKLTSLLPAN